MEQLVLWPQDRVLHAEDEAILGAGVVVQRIQSGNVPAAFDKLLTNMWGFKTSSEPSFCRDRCWFGLAWLQLRRNCAPRPYGVDIGWACSALWPEGLGQMTLLKNNCTWFNTLLIIIAIYCMLLYIWIHLAIWPMRPSIRQRGMLGPSQFTSLSWNQVAQPLEALEASIDKLDMEQLGQKPWKNRGKTVQKVRRGTFVQLGPTQQCTYAFSQKAYDFSIPDSWELLSVPHQMPFGGILFGVTRSHRAVCISWWAAVGISWWAYRKVQPDDLYSLPKTLCIPGKHSWSSEWRTGQTSCFIMFHVLCGISSVLRWNVGLTIVQAFRSNFEGTKVLWLGSDGSMDRCVSMQQIPRPCSQAWNYQCSCIAGIYCNTIFRFFGKHKKDVLPIRIVCPFARESTIESIVNQYDAIS